MRILLAFRRNASGATAIEYGLIVGLIATTILLALTATGGSVSEQWIRWTDAVNEALTR